MEPDHNLKTPPNREGKIHQAHGIPMILAGGDILGAAQIGCGETAAFATADPAPPGEGSIWDHASHFPSIQISPKHQGRSIIEICQNKNKHKPIQDPAASFDLTRINNSVLALQRLTPTFH